MLKWEFTNLFLTRFAALKYCLKLIDYKSTCLMPHFLSFNLNVPALILDHLNPDIPGFII